MGKELYVNRKELEKFLLDNYSGIILDSSDSKLSPFPMNMLVEMNANNIIKPKYREEVEHNPYAISLVVKALILSSINDGIYLVDERFATGVDKISIPGGHLEEFDSAAKPDINYIESELCRELTEELTKTGRIVYNDELCMNQNIVEDTLLHLGVDRIRSLRSVYPVPGPTVFCQYIKSESLIIYVPLVTDLVSNSNFITLTKSDYRVLLDMYNCNGRIPGKQAKRKFLDIASDDVRIRQFESMLMPIFNSYNYIRYSFDYDNIVWGNQP